MAKAKILIVEDERIVAEDIRSSLQNMGYAVSAIVSLGEEAVRKAEELRPDLVLMDIVLEGEMNGIDAADRINSRLGIPVVYLTAYTDEKILCRAKVTGPFGYIVKPFEDRDLRSTIEMALYKHRTDEILREERDKAQRYLDVAEVMFVVVDADRIVDSINKKGCQILECPAEEIVGKNWVDTFLPERIKDRFITAFTKLMAGEIEPVEYFENPVLTKGGDEKIIAWHTTVLRDETGAIIGILGSGMDITERKRAEDELRESREQLRKLTAHAESVREEERTLVAREIHDELGQVLTALKMDLSWLSKKLSAEQETLLEKTKSMITLVDATIQTVKRISTELRPGLLDDLGLAAAIEWQAEEFQSHTGIKCTISIDPEDIVLDKERSTAMFRIFQETLTNIARHAQASKVKVLLKKKNGVIELKVQDNGKGIAKRKPSDPNSYGIIGMRERAQFLGGKVEIRSVRGKGTTVLVTIPIRHTGGIQ